MCSVSSSWIVARKDMRSRLVERQFLPPLRGKARMGVEMRMQHVYPLPNPHPCKGEGIASGIRSEI